MRPGTLSELGRLNDDILIIENLTGVGEMLFCRSISIDIFIVLCRQMLKCVIVVSSSFLRKLLSKNCHSPYAIL